MVQVDFSGNFLSPENCSANDIGTFVDEGKMKDRTSNGRSWKQLIMTVDINQKQLAHSFRTQEGKRFQDLYGTDTKSWIGKQFKTVFIPWVDKDDNNKIKQSVEVIPLEEPKQSQPAAAPADIDSMAKTIVQ